MKNKLKSFGVSLLTFFSLLSLLLVPFGGISAYGQNSVEELCPYTEQCSSEQLLLYPGGMPFGVRIKTGGAFICAVIDFTSGGANASPARDAGLCTGDIIIKVNGEDATDVRGITDKIESAGANGLTLTVLRHGVESNISIAPKIDDKDGKYKLGVRIRDTSAGIGTVTYIMPDGAVFGGLGHGICDSENGELIPIASGSVNEVEIEGIVRGEVGKPGELRGRILAGSTGTLISNTDCGTFGVFDRQPVLCEPMPIATKREVKNGMAEVLCSLDGEGVKRYAVEIYDVRYNDAKTKNFMIKVKDAALLEKTGGIVQGMSGSPLIQDGKIIGAVTHVLINDPTSGYGIFIENMLENTPKALQ